MEIVCIIHKLSLYNLVDGILIIYELIIIFFSYTITIITVATDHMYNVASPILEFYK